MSWDLSSNRITVIQDNVFNGLQNLSELYLSYNQITVVPENAFKGLKNISILDIEGNQITVLDKRFIKDLPKLKRLAVERNPLHCDCILAEFLSFAKSRKVTLKYDKEPECSTPGDLTGVLLKDLSLEEMGCYLTTTTKEDHTIVTTTSLETSGIIIFSYFNPALICLRILIVIR
ncbi:slit homolog 2 protein-like [Saccostrea cucullata]|uniref:slit homolog 2 protein-like n=1 Tax=Saccostrea cuccullata TaxID=36930 RepID=UPI002ED37E88